MPRCMPSVGFIAIVRTRFSPRCCSTSATTSIGVAGRAGLRDDPQGVVDLGQVIVELDVHDRADDLNDAAGVLCLMSP